MISYKSNKKIKLHRLVQALARHKDGGSLGIQKRIVYLFDSFLHSYWARDEVTDLEEYLWSEDSVPGGNEAFVHGEEHNIWNYLSGGI